MGNYLGMTIPLVKGFIPNSDYYDYWYCQQRWGATTTLSNSIGQGKVLTTRFSYWLQRLQTEDFLNPILSKNYNEILLLRNTQNETIQP